MIRSAFVCVPGAGNTIDCTGATLSGTVNVAGTNPTTRTIDVQAFSSAIPGTYTNTAIVDPANAIPEGNETNNTANATDQGPARRPWHVHRPPGRQDRSGPTGQARRPDASPTS